MDSIKSIVVVAILLGVLYGIYQVINDEDSPISTAKSSPNILNGWDSTDSEKSETEKSDANSPTKSSKANSQKNNDTPGSPPAKKRFSVNTPSEGNLNGSPNSFGSNRDLEASPKFAYPEKKGDAQQNNSDGQQQGDSEKMAPGTSAAPASKTFAASDLTAAPSQFDPTATSSTAVLPNSNSPQGNFENNDSIASSWKSSVPANSTDGKSGNSAGFLNPQSRNIQTSAVSDAANIRERFVEGSWADFSKQVVTDMKRAEELINNEDLVSALRLLTKFYDDPRLTPLENKHLLSWLDPLAGKVIYSTEHLLQEKHYVGQSDTLIGLSEKFGVPPELILNINRISIPNPMALTPGTELKIVKGPFHVEVSLSKKRLTLFVQELYAGTFPIRVGMQPSPKPGTYQVKAKTRLGQAYRDQNMQLIDARAPNNPYGNHFIDLGSNFAIHGSAQVSDSNDLRGCISLNAVDAEDVHNILTAESIVTIVE